jgi:integrase
VLSEIDYPWAENWIQVLKANTRVRLERFERRRAALSRVLAWVVQAHPLWLNANPLKLLPHGYSGYDEYTREALAKKNIAIPEDEERNRRIDPHEENLILDALRARRAAAVTLEAQAEAEGMSLIFELALCTATRMRELYTLTCDQISIPERTIFLDKTKNGDARQVPLSSRAIVVLTRPRPALELVRKGNREFPFWNGSLDPEYWVLPGTDAPDLRAARTCSRNARSEDATTLLEPARL